MSATPQESPILRLDNDLLSCILKMNADMFLDNDALKTTWTTSQVCYRWRNFMLSTPSLWAKLIDLNSLQYPAADPWRNELMRRTGSALLWVSAIRYPISDDSTGIVSFFFDILNKNWDRIQRIVVRSINSGDMRPRPRWNPLYLPAPNLQTFSLGFYEDGELNENADKEYLDRGLFSNDAPMLREFHSMKCRFALGAPWLHNLHVLHIDIDLTIKEILTILETTHHLRDLQIREAKLGEVTPSLPFISLPDLSSLAFVAEFLTGTTLLDHLKLPLGCAKRIYLQVIDRVGSFAAEQLCRSSMQTIFRLAKNTFQLYPPRNLLLDISPDAHYIATNTQADEPGHFEFHISSIFSPVLSLYVMVIFFEGFSLPELSEVTELYFGRATGLLPEIFASFSARLSSLAHLDATVEAIHSLVDVQDSLNKFKQIDRPNIMFPLVKTVILNGPWPITVRDTKKVFKFLLSRIKNGRPIDMLDITKCNTGAFSKVDFPKEMAGMKVLWKMPEVDDIVEYICGSGTPDRLCT